MKKQTLLIAIIIVLFGFNSQAQEKPKQPRASNVYVLTQGQVDSLIFAIQQSKPILFKKGSGITLDEAQFIDATINSINNTLTKQYFTFYPQAKIQMDSLAKAKRQ